MSFTPLKPEDVSAAYERIKSHIHRTPLLSSSHLDNWLGHEIIFKTEGFQKIGAFKIRGALNALLKLKEQGNLPEHVVTFSSGNHAQAIALASKMLGVKATIFMTKQASKLKKQATQSYGAEVIITETRPEAEEKTAQMAKDGAYFIHPFDNDMVIVGQGTSCFEALSDEVEPTAIFAPCGGGGLLSGTYLAKELLAPNTPIFAGEPLNANDATRSYASGEIVSYEDSPKTIADGATSLCVTRRTFHYLKKLDGFFEVSEDEIIYWTQWITHLLKTPIEPTCAVAMGAAHQWLSAQDKKQRILVILSGGNIAPETQKQIWEKGCLDVLPVII